MSGERCCLAGDTFHHVAVTAKRVDLEVKDRKSRPIEMAAEPAGGHGHADAIATALSQGTSRRFDSRGNSIFGVSRTSAAELSKLFDVLKAYGWPLENIVVLVDHSYAGEMQHRVKQHRGMTVRQHKPIAIGPRGP